MRRIGRIAALAVLLAGISGCGSSGDQPASAEGGTLTVFAAASLREVFTELGERFEAAHPGSAVEFSFAGSSTLVTQLQHGAAADVFAAAETATMDKAAEAGLLAGSPVGFAANTLTIAVAPGNPKGITGFRDLARTDVAVVVCAPQVPCGAAAETIERATGVRLNPVSEEFQVSDVLGKVIAGEADAGLVYVTDARAAGDRVGAVGFPESADAVNTYPIAVLKQSGNAELAQRFVELVLSDDGRKVLSAAGFAQP